jgi:membrane protease YdiL (CAAX protease family)
MNSLKFPLFFTVAAAETAILIQFLSIENSQPQISEKGFVVLFLLAAHLMMMMLVIGFESLKTPSRSNSPSKMLRKQFIISTVMLSPFLLYIVLKGLPLTAVGLTSKNSGPSLVLSIFLIVTAEIIYPKSILKTLKAERYMWGSVFIVGFSEELIFRGFLQNYLASDRLTPTVAWLVAAAYFAAIHIPQRLVLPKKKGISALPLEQGGIFFCGLVFGGMALAFHNLITPIILHALFDGSEALLWRDAKATITTDSAAAPTS